MEYSGGMRPYPPRGRGTKGSQLNSVPGFGHKTRGQKNSAYRGKKHQRIPSHGDSSEICFNCGSPDHWAQHCPEPPRETHPGGRMQPNPPKRQKTHRFNGGQFHGGPQFQPQAPYDYPPPPMAQGDYDHMPVDPAYESPMPNPRAQQPFGRWHGPPVPHHSREGYSYPPYGPPDAPPPPMSRYGPPFHGPQPQPSQGYLSREYAQGGPGEADYHQHPSDHHQHSPQDRHRRPSSKTWKRPEHAHGPPPPEPWMDELGPLDRDDRSPESQIVWKPPMQVGRPLPSTFDDRDEMSHLPSITSLPRGMSVSNYILDRPAEEFCCNIRETEDWPFMMSDPIFLTISTDSEMIPIEELISRRNQLFETHRVQIKVEIPERNIDHVEDAKSEDHYSNDRKSYDGSFNGSGDERDSHYQSSPGGHSLTPSPRSPCGPELPEQGPSTPVDQLESPSMGLDDPARNSVASEPKLENDDDYRRPTKAEPDDPADNPKQEASEPRQNGEQCPNADEQSRGRSNADHLSKKRNSFERRSNQANKFGPQSRCSTKQRSFSGEVPNPGPRKDSGFASGPHVQFHAEDHNSGNLKAENSPDQAGNSASHQNHGNQNSPDQLENNDGQKESKKDERPAGTHDEPRRQKDDTAAKMKRRQPRVAEAYSRRW